jgi:hypothetical protein
MEATQLPDAKLKRETTFKHLDVNLIDRNGRTPRGIEPSRHQLTERTTARNA